MKEINELIIPDSVYYAEDHEWARVEDNIVTIGISDYAQDQLGDIVFVELPEVGDTFKKGDEFGSLESVKAVSELYMPMGGEVINVNDSLQDAPELVNESPYGDGWMIEIAPDDLSEVEKLLNRDTYIEMLERDAHIQKLVED